MHGESDKVHILIRGTRIHCTNLVLPLAPDCLLVTLISASLLRLRSGYASAAEANMSSAMETATPVEAAIAAAVETPVFDAHVQIQTSVVTGIRATPTKVSENQAERPRRSLREALPVIKMAPYLMFEAIMHAAYLRNAGHGWDLRTHMIVSMVRRFMYHEGKTVEEVQSSSRKGLPFQSDEVEVLPFVIPVPQAQEDFEFLEHKIKTAIDRLTREAGLAEPTIPDPTVVEVHAEWVIEKRCEGKEFVPTAEDVVVIFAHGGAHYLGSAAAHRFLTGPLVEFTQVKVLSLDYRLSPQNPLPAALTDFLVSYFYVVETLKVSPSRIVFVGDSSGGCLILSALGVILYACRLKAPRRPSSSTTFHLRTSTLN
ncbi:hypothetical protein V1517DRAFT_181863 [Lipomyces orientalis]|uniref:Uncharacterized protein n=1 Tax=Lipomyces orientalis TaxID=1233043 RepID=A0ACC3TJ99_9ASCO